MTLDFIADFRSGTITENSWWKSKLELNGDFLIDNNAILSIECDTVVLNGNVLKIVNGQITKTTNVKFFPDIRLIRVCPQIQ
jgi:hypothetical protein